MDTRGNVGEVRAPRVAESVDIKHLGKSYFSPNSWSLVNVPLNMIEYKNWNPARYEDNKGLIQSTGSVKPVIIYDYDTDSKRYVLNDGNHRSFVANELGYTHIPAIIRKTLLKKRTAGRRSKKGRKTRRNRK